MNDAQRLYVMARCLTMTARVSEDTHTELMVSTDELWSAMSPDEQLQAVNAIDATGAYTAPLSIAYGE